MKEESMYWYLEVMKKYAVFSGRARRKEYWYFVLCNVFVSIILNLIDSLIGSFNAQTGWGLLSGIYTLVILLPSIAVSVRRLHDTGRTGWWILFSFVPVIGFIVLLIFFVSDSKPRENEYGPWPKLVVI